MALVSVTNKFFRKGHKDSFDDCSSFRSLSIACQFGGPSERMLCKNPNQFLDTNNVLADNQEGFTRKRSTFRLLYWLYLNLEHSSFPLSPHEDKVLSPLLFVIFLNDFSSDEPWRTSLTTVLFWFNAKMKAISSKKFDLSCKWIGRWWNKWRMGVKGSKIELKVLNLAFHTLMKWLQYL